MCVMCASRESKCVQHLCNIFVRGYIYHIYIIKAVSVELTQRCRTETDRFTVPYLDQPQF